MAKHDSFKQMKIMNHHINYGFSTIKNSPAITPLDRHILFKESALRDIDDPDIVRLLSVALDDAGTIAFSAYSRALSRRCKDTPLAITKRSLSLLDVASLSPSREQGFFYVFNDVGTDRQAPFIKIHPRYLDIVKCNTGIEIQYGREPLELLNASTENNPGCPAQGIILNSFYQRYVSSVLGH